MGTAGGLHACPPCPAPPPSPPNKYLLSTCCVSVMGCWVLAWGTGFPSSSGPGTCERAPGGRGTGGPQRTGPHTPGPGGRVDGQLLPAARWAPSPGKVGAQAPAQDPACSWPARTYSHLAASSGGSGAQRSSTCRRQVPTGWPPTRSSPGPALRRTGRGSRHANPHVLP